jgi:hypothetical protein
MSAESAFDWVCSEIETHANLNRLEARGTVRLALKQAGLEPRRVAPDQLQVVITKVLAPELEARGVEDSKAMCGEVALALASANVSTSTGSEGPEDVFGRLGG